MRLTVIAPDIRHQLFVFAFASRCLRELKLDRSRLALSIELKRGLKEQDNKMHGVTMRFDGEIGTLIEPSLDTQTLMLTIAHEMIHVKQLATGLLRFDEGPIWRGQRVNLETTRYIDLPWEAQAYARQSRLAFIASSV